MSFQAPEWLLLGAALLFAAWQWPRLWLRSPLRLVCVGLVVCALAEPFLSLRDSALSLVVLVDRSASARDLLGTRTSEWESILKKSMPGGDSITFLDFADEAVIRGEGDPGYFDKAPAETRIALAVRTALSRTSTDRSSRFLLLSDGYSTEPLAGISELLSRAEIALDLRTVSDGAALDYRIESLRTPAQVGAAEPFIVDMSVAGNGGDVVSYEIFKQGVSVSKGSVQVTQGRASVRFSDRLDGAAGAVRYEARIFPPNDAHPGNNRAESWSELTGQEKILLITAYANDPLAQILADDRRLVRVVHEPEKLSLGMLSGAQAVILNNIPAHRIPRAFMSALAFFVTEQGGGLLLAGGKDSFGSGGYYSSTVDEVLPISMEQRDEVRATPAAIAIAIDRSGSMAAQVEGNMGSMQKIDLANEGAARAVSLMSAQDSIAVFAVDSEPHEVVPLTIIGRNPEGLTRQIRSITSGGGGIYVFNALQAAWDALKKASSPTKHVILFSDAADSEEPGDYQRLLAEMEKAGATVSVIGLGREQDQDAQLLKDVAARGRGRMFFVSNALEVPAVFAQETVAVSRSTFVTDPSAPKALAGWREFSASELPWPRQIDGYNLNYSRPGATIGVVSSDEYAAPLFAFWQRGAGRSVALSMPLAGEYSSSMRSWPHYANFIQSVVRWMKRADIPPGLMPRYKRIGDSLQIDLFYERAWEKQIAESGASLAVSKGADGAAQRIPWERVGPGHFRSSVVLKSGEILRGVIQVGAHTLPFGPVSGNLSAEWSFDRERLHELREVSRASGGVERLDLSTVWQAPRTLRELDLRMAVLCLFVGVFLCEALLTRLNRRLTLPRLELSSLKLRLYDMLQTRKTRLRAPSAAKEAQGVVEQKSPAQAALSEVERSKQLFDKAKRRGL